MAREEPKYHRGQTEVLLPGLDPCGWVLLCKYWLPRADSCRNAINHSARFWSMLTGQGLAQKDKVGLAEHAMCRATLFKKFWTGTLQFFRLG